MAASMKTVVLITGCSKGGIGFALCEAFAAKGSIVYATARKPESLEELSQPNIHQLILDVTDHDGVKKTVQTIIDREGQIDVLVNNAGVGNSSPLIDVEMGEIMRIFDTNLFSTIRIAKAVIPHLAARKRGTVVNVGSITGIVSTHPLGQMGEIMRIFDTNLFATIRIAKAIIPHMAARKRGTVVNVGSITGLVPLPWAGVYSATKAALHSLTDTLYMECKPLHIDVVLLAPGCVRSNIAANQAPRVHLPADTLYGDYIDAVLHRLTVGLASFDPLPTDVFARSTVDAVLRPGGPPRYMSLGRMSWWYRVFEWLPRGWVLDLFWRRLGEGGRKAAQKTR